MPRKDGSLVLSADEAYIHNNEGSRDARVQQHDGLANIGYWTDAEAWVQWSFKIDKPGKYEVWAELAVEKGKSRFSLSLPDQQMEIEVLSTGGYGNYETKPLGIIDIDKAGEYTLRMKPDKDHWQPVNLRLLELKLRSTG